MKGKFRKILAQGYLWLLLLVLYTPIAIIAIFSFTETKILGNWTGFSLNLYKNMFVGDSSGPMLSAIKNTLIIAFIAATIATLLGSLSAIGIYNLRNRKRKAITFLNNIPIINPDIITGISLFLLFVWLGVSQGYVTVILAHITFCTPYVVLSVMPRLTGMNQNIYEAALDLGATPFQALTKVILPEIKPGIISGFILSFTLSIDDFAVSLFTKGNIGLETLSTYIYSDARKGGLTPEIRALSTLVFVVILILLLIINWRSERLAKLERQRATLLSNPRNKLFNIQ
jgi:spermidine/putrescine transport system permease protein